MIIRWLCVRIRLWSGHNHLMIMKSVESLAEFESWEADHEQQQ